MIPSKEKRDEWRKLAENTDMISAVGEYTPNEFMELLDAVDRLETLLNPRLWTKEMCEAWHRELPDMQAAFNTLRRIA